MTRKRSAGPLAPFCLAAIVAQGGCSSEQNRYRISIWPHQMGGAAEVRVSFAGHPLHQVGRERDELEFAFRISGRLSEKLGELGVQVPTTCGWKALRLEDLDGLDPEALRKEENTGKLVQISLSMTARTPMNRGFYFHVDNAGGPKTKVELGEIAVDVEAAAQGRALMADCPRDASVRVGGQPVGTVDERGWASVIVDAVGGKCYEVEKIQYASSVGFPSGGGTPWTETKRGARVYTVREKIDDFLRTPPESISRLKGDKGPVERVFAGYCAPAGR